MATKEKSELTADQLLVKEIKKLEKTLSKNEEVKKPKQEFFYRGLDRTYNEHRDVFDLTASLADLNSVEATAKAIKIKINVSGKDSKGKKDTSSFANMRKEMIAEISYRQNREVRQANEEALSELRGLLSDSQREAQEQEDRKNAIFSKIKKLTE